MVGLLSSPWCWDNYFYFLGGCTGVSALSGTWNESGDLNMTIQGASSYGRFLSLCVCVGGFPLFVSNSW